MEFQLPRNNNALGYAIVAILFVISTISVLLRFNTKILILRQPSIVDILLAAGYGGWTACIAFTYGLGQNPSLFVYSDELPVNLVALILFLRTVFILSVLLSFYIPLLKSAIRLEWIQNFVPKGTRNAIFWSFHFVMWSNIVFYIVIIVLEFISCSPVACGWDKTIHGGHCNIFNLAWLGAVTSRVNLLTDIAIFLIPQQVVWRLNMSRAKKVGVSIVFAVGILGVVAAVVRTVYIVRSAREYTTNYTYAFSSVVLAVLAESTSIIFVFVICAPAALRTVATIPKVMTSLRSLADKSVEWLRGSTRSRMESKSSRRPHIPTFGSPKNNDSYAELDSYHMNSLSQRHFPQTEISLQIQQQQANNVRGPTLSQRGIVRETEFDATSVKGYDSNSAEEQLAHQHPWINDDRA
ncbi:hypothetical protein O1611_g972 [Lasiodiplodia mahajangana]|uniref:Uncharacterized protein n=1 Tax=Lasiodiplodia mahajangana TaxID=1108764 RepID=A0ACC2JZL9_9PEZI|nr:hypothetical protein O1611_g972 [Lasiodiplodia mahajangana]